MATRFTAMRFKASVTYEGFKAEYKIRCHKFSLRYARYDISATFRIKSEPLVRASVASERR